MNKELVLEYSEKTELLGELSGWQGKSEVREPGCDDVLQVYFKTQREIITQLSYTITPTACPPAKACAALAAELALGKPVMEAYLIDAARLSTFFGGLPKESYHCAMMAELGLKKAIQDYALRRPADGQA